MTALSAENVSKVKFHLGYNYGVPAQDLARLTRACNEVADEWTKTKIETQIARCETAYDLQDLEAGAFNPQFETEVTGDIGRVIQTKEKDPYSRRQRFYLEATNYLARTLGIRNYRDPSQADQGFLVDGGLYVNSIEGPQGPQGSIVPDAPSDGSVYGRSDAAWSLAQPYNADTVIDATYVATENSYTTTEKNKLAGIETGATADQTGAEIKTLYEAEADTNAYTDAEKTKLAGIASGAEVNVQSDWDAISGDAFILNKPSTFPPSSHTQTASTITDFDTEVSNNTDVAANTSARHDAVTVVDSSEIDFTLTGQQITASIVAGSIDESKLDASVNASLDLADTATQPADIADLESIVGAISPTGGLNTSITIPLSPYGVNAYTYADQPLLGRYFPYDLIVSGVSLTLDTAPTGSAFQVDVKQNGVSIFSVLLTVADGQTGSSTYTFANTLTLFSTGDLITFDVTQIGSTTPGKYPVLTIEGIRGDVQSVVVPLSPLGVSATLTTDQALLGRSFPYDFQIDDIILTLDTAPTGSTFIVDVKKNSVSIFNTLLSVDDGEDTSTTATTAYALTATPTTITKGDLVTFSITQIGATTSGKYPVVTIIGREV